MANADIREAIRNAGVKHWQVAYALNVDESTLCRRLRRELSDDQKKAVFEAIEAAARTQATA